MPKEQQQERNPKQPTALQLKKKLFCGEALTEAELQKVLDWEKNVALGDEACSAHSASGLHVILLVCKRGLDATVSQLEVHVPADSPLKHAGLILQQLGPDICTVLKPGSPSNIQAAMDETSDKGTEVGGNFTPDLKKKQPWFMDVHAQATAADASAEAKKRLKTALKSESELLRSQTVELQELCYWLATNHPDSIGGRAQGYIKALKPVIDAARLAARGSRKRTTKGKAGGAGAAAAAGSDGEEDSSDASETDAEEAAPHPVPPATAAATTTAAAAATAAHATTAAAAARTGGTQGGVLMQQGQGVQLYQQQPGMQCQQQPGVMFGAVRPPMPGYGIHPRNSGVSMGTMGVGAGMMQMPRPFMTPPPPLTALAAGALPPNTGPAAAAVTGGAGAASGTKRNRAAAGHAEAPVAHLAKKARKSAGAAADPHTPRTAAVLESLDTLTPGPEQPYSPGEMDRLLQEVQEQEEEQGDE